VVVELEEAGMEMAVRAVVELGAEATAVGSEA